MDELNRLLDVLELLLEASRDSCQSLNVLRLKLLAFALDLLKMRRRGLNEAIDLRLDVLAFRREGLRITRDHLQVRAGYGSLAIAIAQKSQRPDLLC